MTLKEYLQQENLKPYQFARKYGIAPSTIYKVLKGNQTLSVKLALHIERCTEGRVSRAEALWPDFYLRQPIERQLGCF
jgi:DNA-binding transcriptional regulator YdaS (Cro superfamily)